MAFRYTDGHRSKVMRLAGVEFVRCFLLHVLPKGFMRIRRYGFLAEENSRACLGWPEMYAQASAACKSMSATLVSHYAY